MFPVLVENILACKTKVLSIARIVVVVVNVTGMHACMMCTRSDVHVHPSLTGINLGNDTDEFFSSCINLHTTGDP